MVKPGNAFSEHPLQHALIRHARGPLCGGSTPVTFAADLELAGFRLSHTLHREPEDFILNLGFQHSAHEVSFRRPQMQQALVAFPGDRIPGLGQIEDHGSIFNDNGIARTKEKIFDSANQGLWRHRGIVSVDPLCGL